MTGRGSSDMKSDAEPGLVVMLVPSSDEPFGWPFSFVNRFRLTPKGKISASLPPREQRSANCGPCAKTRSLISMIERSLFRILLGCGDNSAKSAMRSEEHTSELQSRQY